MSRDVMDIQRWMYRHDIPPELDSTKELIEGYCHMSPEDTEAQLHAIRNFAWSISRIPSVGRWKFLRLAPRKCPHYTHALARLRSPSSHDALLDLGCGVGQVLRQLVHDGADAGRLFGLDVRPDYLLLGRRLFSDADRLPDRQFVVADVLDPADTSWADALRAKGNITMVHAANFWHLFSWDAQVTIAVRVVREVLSLPWGATMRGMRRWRWEGSSSKSKRLFGRSAMMTRGGAAAAAGGQGAVVIFGTQAGSLRPGETTAAFSPSYLHDEASLQCLWDEVGRLTETRWRVEVEIGDEVLDQESGVGEHTRLMRYGVYLR